MTHPTTYENSTPRFAALHHRDFFLIWIGYLVSSTGTQMQFLAVNWHVFDLLRGETYTLALFGRTFALDASALGLGSIGLVRVIPIILFALLGGLLADARDRRKLLLWVQVASTLIAGLLAVFTLLDRISIPMIYLLTGAGAAASALEQPARQSIVPSLVPRQHLTNAISLNTLMNFLATVIGPMLSGVLVGAFNVGLVYALNAISFVAVIISLLLMEYRSQETAAETTGLGWNALVEGLRFTFGSHIIRSTMLLDFFATFFSSARTMLPLVAENVLGVGVQGYGLLSTAQPVGAVLAGMVMAWRKDVNRQGIVLLASVVVYGAATALFGVSTWFLLSYILFALTGAGDTVSTVIRGTLRQVLTPDRLRGRMVSVNMVFFMGGPQLGELEAGLVAAVWGVPFAIVSGGIATVVLTAWIAWQYPSLRNFTREQMVAAEGMG